MLTYADPTRLPGRRKYYSRTYDSATGKRGWIGTGCSDLKTAKAWIATRRMEQAMGPERVKAAKVSGTTVAQAVDVWLEEKREKVSAAHFANCRYRAIYWKDFFGSKRISDVTPDDVRTFLRKRKAGSLGLLTHARGGKISATTANDERNAIGNLFNFAMRNEWLVRSPVLAVERYKGEARRRVRSLSEDQEENLLRACHDPVEILVRAKRNTGGPKGGAVSAEKREFRQGFTPPAYLRPIVLVALKSGLRRRTILSLHWKDCDLERAVWSIPGESVKTSEPYQQPMAASVVETLKSYRSALLGEGGPARVAPDATIFPLAPTSSFRKAFQGAAKRAGLDGLTFHDLRRVFLNRLRERGVPIDAAMALTGHRSIQVVMRHYREVPETATRAAVASLDAPTASKEIPRGEATRQA